MKDFVEILIFDAERKQIDLEAFVGNSGIFCEAINAARQAAQTFKGAEKALAVAEFKSNRSIFNKDTKDMTDEDWNVYGELLNAKGEAEKVYDVARNAFFDAFLAVHATFWTEAEGIMKFFGYPHEHVRGYLACKYPAASVFSMQTMLLHPMYEKQLATETKAENQAA